MRCRPNAQRLTICCATHDAKKLKIALVRGRYNPYGGAERFVARAMAALSAGDAEVAADVTVLAREWVADASDAGAGDAAPVRFVRCDPFYLGSVWRDASFARAVRLALARERFDLVQSHERIAGLPVYRAGDGVHAAWLARRTARLGPLARMAIALNPHHRYLLAVERAMFEHPALAAVICNSDMVRREILARFAVSPDKLVLIRNGVDLQRFHPAARMQHRAATRARLSISADAPVFVLVGSGFERKGVADALTALQGVDAAACLIVVGDDKRRARYEAQAARLGVAARVRFVGAQADPLPCYAAADVFVLPTLYDPFPNAALEALACGLPVATTDACGASELIAPNRNGWVVPAGDVPALTHALREAAAMTCEPDKAAQWSRAAHAAAEPWSMDALSTALLALYRRVLGAPSPR